MDRLSSEAVPAPYWVQLLIGGWDSEGGHIFSIDAAGGSIPDKYCSTGSGSPFAYGVLEEGYKDGINTKDGVDLAIKALHAAMKRDSASGDGYDVVVINSKGWNMVSQDDVAKRKQKLNIK